MMGNRKRESRIATLIHVFSIGYMSDELADDYVDHQVHTHDGGHLHRPGRYYLFFAYMSLFCFSMLGLVLAGNIFQVFIFWELVGICSYFLIGFYVASWATTFPKTVAAVSVPAT